jgi:hypothetical protein
VSSERVAVAGETRARTVVDIPQASSKILSLDVCNALADTKHHARYREGKFTKVMWHSNDRVRENRRKRASSRISHRLTESTDIVDREHVCGTVSTFAELHVVAQQQAIAKHHHYAAQLWAVPALRGQQGEIDGTGQRRSDADGQTLLQFFVEVDQAVA